MTRHLLSTLDLQGHRCYHCHSYARKVGLGKALVLITVRVAVSQKQKNPNNTVHSIDLFLKMRACLIRPVAASTLLALVAQRTLPPTRYSPRPFFYLLQMVLLSVARLVLACRWQTSFRQLQWRQPISSRWTGCASSHLAA